MRSACCMDLSCYLCIMYIILECIVCVCARVRACVRVFCVWFIFVALYWAAFSADYALLSSHMTNKDDDEVVCNKLWTGIVLTDVKFIVSHCKCSVLAFCIYLAIVIFNAADIPMEWRERWSSKNFVNYNNNARLIALYQSTCSYL